MTVKELKEILKDLPDNMEVILSRDEEGNAFHPLAGTGVSPCTINDYGIDVYSDDDELAEGLTHHCLVLWP